MFSRTLLGVSAFVLLGSGLFAFQKKPVTAQGIAPSANFSHGIQSGDTLYVSGQVGRGADGKRPESFEDEVKATFDSINAILKAGGMTMADVVSSNVYLTDMSLFERMNKVYVANMPEPRPVRTTVGVAALVGTFRIEITVIAKHGGPAGKKK